MPRFDSTSVMPTLPRMDVSAANTADPAAYSSHVQLRGVPPSTGLRSIISQVPTAMIAMPPSRVGR